MRSNRLNSARKGLRQKGFSLLEILVVLVVIGLIAVGIYASFGTARSGALNKQATEGALGIVAAVSRNFPSPSYGANGADLVPAIVRQAPKNIVNSANNTLRDPWGNTITVVSSGAGATYTITFPAVPVDECRPFVSGTVENFRTVRIGTTDIKVDGGAVNQTNLNTACNPATGTTVSVALIGA